MKRIHVKHLNKNLKFVLILFLIVYLLKVNQYAYKYLHNSSIQKKKLNEMTKLLKKKDRKIETLRNEINKLRNENFNSNLNRCINEKVPKVSGILETAEYLRFHNKSLIRYGDGEINLMLMNDIPAQSANQKLSEELLNAFTTNNENVIIGIRNIFSGFPGERKQSVEFWLKNHPELGNYLLKNYNQSKRYFDAFISSPYTSTYNTSCELIDLVYKELREIWRDKDLVILRGNNSQVYNFDVYDTAKSQKTFFCSKTNVWDEYEELKRLLLSQDPSSLYIIAAGPVSEIIVMDLVNDNRRALDLGHLAKDYDLYMKHAEYNHDFWFDWK